MDQILALRIYKTIVGIVGILGNSLVCLVIWRVPAMQTRTNAFIFHQAVIDFIGSTVIILEDGIPLPDVLSDDAHGWVTCHVWISKALAFTVYAASTFNLLTVTLERYFAIVHPFKYEAALARYPRLKVGLAIGTCWLASVILYSFSFPLFEVRDGQCVSVPGFTGYGVIVVLVTYVAPVAVMLFAYIRTSAELKRGADRMGPSSGQADMVESLLRARRNTFKTLLIVFIVFMVCWTPNELIFLSFNFGLPLTYQEWYFLLSVAMVATNSCVNPLIYSVKYRQFRKGLRQIFCGKRSQGEISDATQTTASHP